MLRLSLLFLVGACTGDSAGADSSDTSGADTDTAGGEDTGVSPDAPVIAGPPTADCWDNVDAEPTWIVEAPVTDPQGDENISVVEGYVVIIQGGMAGTHRGAVFAGGVLSGSWTSSADEEPCTLTGTVRMIAIDDEGHESAPADLEWPVE